MILLITEKPSVAMTIGKVIGCQERGDGYIKGNGYLVSWCVGHLVELSPPEEYDEKFKKWSRENLPIIPQAWRCQIKDATKSQFNVLKNLMNGKDTEEIICCTDCGREGELIFRLVYEMAGCHKSFSRLWISSLEADAILEGIRNRKPGSAYDDLYQSALCRQRADWLVGMNGTRLFTTLYGGRVLKVGRVQTPTLSMIVERDREISEFVKKPYYQVAIELDGFRAISERIDDKVEAEALANACNDSTAVVRNVITEKKSLLPPKLFDLTSLQREANKLFGFTAKETLEITQSLYEKKLVTYPRTDSQYLSDDMAATASKVIHLVRNHLDFISEAYDIGNNCGRIPAILNSKKVSDHHAIIPTAEIENLGSVVLLEKEEKILELIGCRLLCATGEKQEYLQMKAELICNEKTFTVKGRIIIENGWKDFEEMLKNHFRMCSNTETDGEADRDDGKDGDPDNSSLGDSGEKILSSFSLPDIKKNGSYQVLDSTLLEKTTKPPAHFNESSILSAMEHAGAADTCDDAERKGLGTPATRADVLEKLVRDGYVRRDKKQLLATEDGRNLIRVLPELVKSPALTSDWENDLTRISKGTMDAKDFMNEIEEMIYQLTDGEYVITDEDRKAFERSFQSFKKTYQNSYKSATGKSASRTKNNNFKKRDNAR